MKKHKKYNTSLADFFGEAQTVIFVLQVVTVTKIMVTNPQISLWNVLHFS
ncbi:hypothetical protein FDUTEX481_03861 [Tolypothrix sp. PCC 7601]|nr:hypothetical protein FDUTEX481_03861 [Tolypothrix sp. PCC 7601]